MSSYGQQIEKDYYLGHSEGRCPYLPDRGQSLLFINGLAVGEDYRALMDEGYRRHGLLAYRPDCAGCSECQVIRVPVNAFKRSKSQRRVWNKGREAFHVGLGPAEYTDEKLDLYRRYLAAQHGTTDDQLDEDRYREFFVNSFLGRETCEIRLRMGRTLAGVGIIDLMPDAMSSVYFYYHPDAAPYSPGVFSALAEIELAKDWGLDYYYLGYFIADCRTMNYKMNYRPCEIRRLDEPMWRRVE